MIEIPHETQYGLDTFEPNMPTAAITLPPSGAGEAKTYFIRCRPTMRWWTGNAYNVNILGTPNLPFIPGQPLPQCRVQIAVYRSIIPVPRTFVAATPFATMVTGTYYDSGNLPAINLTAAKLTFAPLALGGSYWIVVRVEDTTVGGNSMVFTSLGWSIVDANIMSTLLQDATSTGNLPASYLINQVIGMTAEYPWVKMDYV